MATVRVTYGAGDVVLEIPPDPLGTDPVARIDHSEIRLTVEEARGLADDLCMAADDLEAES